MQLMSLQISDLFYLVEKVIEFHNLCKGQYLGLWYFANYPVLKVKKFNG